MVTRTATSSLCRSCRRKLLLTKQSIQQSRSLASTTAQSLPPPSSRSPRTPRAAPKSRIYEILTQNDRASPQDSEVSPTSPTPHQPSANVTDLFNQAQRSSSGSSIYDNQPYHLNLFAHKHNTHLTFTSPSFNPILSFSCGQLGLRKAQRGSFDAAYQLCTFMFRKMSMAQWRHGGKKLTKNPLLTLQDVGTKMHDGGKGLEIVVRGYGQGREALQKALLGQEGSEIRKLVCKVTDGTRLKFGGTRSPAVRRLG